MDKAPKVETHFPRSADCQDCLWCLTDCDFDFSKMPVHKRYKDGNTSVKCTERE